MKTCAFLVFVLLILSQFVSAYAEDAAILIARCDAAASNPADPERHAVKAGVPFDRIDPTIAIPACEAASKIAPGNKRIALQLGLAYDADESRQNGHRFPDDGPIGEQARDQYRKADALGSIIANYILCSSPYVGRCGAKAAAAMLPEALELKAEQALWCPSADKQDNLIYITIMQQAAGRGNTLAMEMLRIYFEMGKVVPKDQSKADYWKWKRFYSIDNSHWLPSRGHWHYTGGCTF